MKQWGVAPDRITINAEIDRAIKRGRLEEAVDIFEKMLNGVSVTRLGFDLANSVLPWHRVRRVNHSNALRITRVLITLRCMCCHRASIPDTSLHRSVYVNASARVSREGGHTQKFFLLCVFFFLHLSSVVLASILSRQGSSFPSSIMKWNFVYPPRRCSPLLGRM